MIMSNYIVTPVVLKNWYDEYNKKYFGSELPEATTANFAVRNYQSYGKTQYPRIVRGKRRGWIISESNHYEIDEYNRRGIMLHEMCHLWCWSKGYKKEHHGPRWRAIAFEVSQKSGFDIQRLHPEHFQLSKAGAIKRSRQVVKKQKPQVFLVYPYGNENVVVVKTTSRVLGKGMVWRNNAYRINSAVQPEALFLSGSFPSWPLRRSVYCGIVKSRKEYMDNIYPVLSEGRRYDTVHELYRASL